MQSGSELLCQNVGIDVSKDYLDVGTFCTLGWNVSQELNENYYK